MGWRLGRSIGEDLRVYVITKKGREGGMEGRDGI